MASPEARFHAIGAENTWANTWKVFTSKQGRAQTRFAPALRPRAALIGALIGAPKLARRSQTPTSTTTSPTEPADRDFSRRVGRFARVSKDARARSTAAGSSAPGARRLL